MSERKTYQLTAEESVVVDAMRRARQEQAEPSRMILVLGASSHDARRVVDAFEATGREDILVATPKSGILSGLPRPAFVVRTAAYEALNDPEKQRIENELRIISAKP